MRFSKLSSYLTYLMVILPITNAQAQSAPTVPASETKMYSALNLAVGNFQSSLDTRSQSASSTAFAAKLGTADATMGPALLTKARLNAVAAELARYQQMGVQGVVIHVGFPILCQQFYTWNKDPQDFQNNVAFYQQVFQLCQKAGIKTLVESHPLYPDGPSTFARLTQRYTETLNSKNFSAAMAQNNATIATVNPGIISIVNEPNTDYAWTYQSAYHSPAQLAALVQASATAIKAANPATTVAAGAPQWQPDAQLYNSLFCKISSLDAIDIHIYFCGNKGFETATTMADYDHAQGKQVVVSECWLTTVGTGTPPETAETNQANYAMSNNAYSFWEPLNEITIYSFFKWCNVEQPQFFAFFYSQLLFADLNYAQWHTKSNDAIIQAEQQASDVARIAGQLTPVGAYYAKLLNAPRLSQY